MDKPRLPMDDKWKAQLCSVLLKIVSNSNVYSQDLANELEELISLTQEE
jgi:hypothetical protein